MLERTPRRQMIPARKRILRQWSTADRWTPPRPRGNALDIIAFAFLIVTVLTLAGIAIIDPRTLQEWLR